MIPGYLKKDDVSALTGRNTLSSLDKLQQHIAALSAGVSWLNGLVFSGDTCARSSAGWWGIR